MKKKLTGGEGGNFSCSFYLYRFGKYVSCGFPVIIFCNPGVHFETPCKNDSAWHSHNCATSAYEVPAVNVRFKSNLNFLGRFFAKKKNPQIANIMEIRLVGAELFQAGGRKRNMATLTVAILKYANAPNERNAD